MGDVTFEPTPEKLMPDLTPREELVVLARCLWREGYNDHLAGHITFNLGDGTLLCNPWLITWDELRPHQVIRIDLEGNVVEGDWPAPLGIPLHLALHEARARRRVGDAQPSALRHGLGDMGDGPAADGPELDARRRRARARRRVRGRREQHARRRGRPSPRWATPSSRCSPVMACSCSASRRGRSTSAPSRSSSAASTPGTCSPPAARSTRPSRSGGSTGCATATATTSSASGRRWSARSSAHDPGLLDG